MTISRFHLGIVGGGSAAFAAATRANDLGVSTALVNEGPIGGTCVNVGCIPSKHLLALGDAIYYPERPSFGSLRRNRVRFDFAGAIREKDEVVEELR
ncbi:MAG: FAD-dependent oxidoreductase, partial [Candidatus Geothermarchaeales archaeon]